MKEEIECYVCSKKVNRPVYHLPPICKSIIDNFRGEYFFLSNFYPCQIIFKDKMFPSVEHLYQSLKMTSEIEADIIRRSATAGRAKKLGQTFKARDDWEEIKGQIMIKIVRLKFQQNNVLRQKLIRTGNAELVEGNYWHDNIWGVCNCSTCKGAGQNHLGKILMKIRGELTQ